MVKQLKWSWAIWILTIIAGLAAISFADPSAQVPVHWNAAGEVDGTANPVRAFLFAPGFQLLILGIFSFITKLEPRKENLENSQKAVKAIVLSVILLLAAIQLLMIAQLFSPGLIGPNVIYSGIGLSLAVMGNYFGKLRSSFFIGIRTPWTLSSDTVWKKTHRLGGKLMVTGGLLLFVASLVLPTPYMVFAVFGLIIPSALVPAVYSWVLWRNEQEK